MLWDCLSSSVSEHYLFFYSPSSRTNEDLRLTSEDGRLYIYIAIDDSSGDVAPEYDISTKKYIVLSDCPDNTTDEQQRGDDDA